MYTHSSVPLDLYLLTELGLGFESGNALIPNLASSHMVLDFPLFPWTGGLTAGGGDQQPVQ